MAIAIVATTNTSSEVVDMTAVSSITLTGLTVSGSNTALFLLLHTLRDGSGGASAVSWDSAGTPQAMTKIRTDIASSGGTDSCSEVWRLVAPTAGNKSLAVTLNANMHVAAATLVCLSGVNQSTPAEANEGSVDAGGGDVTDDITTLTNGALVLQCMSGKTAAGGVSQDSGQTEWVDVDTAGATDTLAWCDAYESIATAGLNSFATSGWGADDVAISLVAVKPAADTTTPSLNLLGVGT